MYSDAISPFILSDCDKNIGDTNHRNGYKEENYSTNQVDSCSKSSEEDEDSHFEDLVIAAPTINPNSVPIFESVSVVNSNDVHFGNKTIYQGPVTIKQIVYSDKKLDLNSSDVENRIVENSTNVSAGSEVSGVCNLGFEKDDFVGGSTKSESKADSNHVDKALQDDACRSKILGCCHHITKPRLKHRIIALSVAIVALVIALGIFLWKFQVTTAVDAKSDSHKIKIEEEDKQTPVDYSSDSNATLGPKVRIFTRLEWLAQPPVDKLDPLKLPVSLIIIQHTSTEGCDSQAQCVFQTRIIQTFHIESRGWFDIAYNFLIGGDGNAYEGRGWKMEGAHTFGYNNISIGFGFIGTFNNAVPPPRQIHAFHKMVELGVRLGHISKDYKIVAARQLYGTESPGKTFFEEIKKWKHWSKTV